MPDGAEVRFLPFLNGLCDANPELHVYILAWDFHVALASAGLAAVASYAVAMAYRVRYYLELNAREAMHMLELRTAPQGHPAYRRVCQAMHRLIAERAGHTALAETMRFVDHSAVELERLEAERRTDARRRALLEAGPADRA